MDTKNCRLDFLENCQVQPSPSLGPKNNLNFFTLFYVLPFIEYRILEFICFFISYLKNLVNKNIGILKRLF